jgi:tRNA (cmo5U34)-methyltransferase
MKKMKGEKSMDRMKKVLSHFEEEAAEFDQTIVKLIPNYHKMCEILLDFIPYSQLDNFSVVDLGCGTGTLAKRIADKYPNAQITCVDISENMLELAKHKIQKPITLIKNDFYELEFTQTYDVMVSSLALHHLDTTQDKLMFYKKIFHALSQKGIFINVDIMLGCNSFVQKKYLEYWKSFMLESVSEEKVENQWLPNYYSEDRPASLATHFDLLKKSGFSFIDCVYKNYNYGVYLAQKS